MNDIYQSYQFNIFHKKVIIILSVIISISIFTIIPLLTIQKNTKKMIKTFTIQTIPLPNKKKLSIKKISSPKIIKTKEIVNNKKNIKYIPLPVDISVDLDNNITNISQNIDFTINNKINNLNYVFKISNVDIKPIPIFQPSPKFPKHAKRDNVKGVVELEFIVTKNGDVTQIKVLRENNGQYFIDSAIKALSKWKFKPAIKNKHSVAVKVSIPFSFNPLNMIKE